MEIDQYGWVDATKYVPSSSDQDVIVDGDGWSTMAIAYYGSGYLRINGRVDGDPGKVCWRYSDGRPLGLHPLSKPITRWTNLPPRIIKS